MTARQLRYATANSVRGDGLQNRVEGWPEFVARFDDPERVAHTTAALDVMDPASLREVKDVGWYMGGYLKPLRRRKENVRTRGLMALDADHCPEGRTVESMAQGARDILGVEVLAHTTLSHRPGAPRIRLLIPLAQEIKPHVYEPLSRYLAEDLCIEMFDSTTHQAARIMYWPACASDGEYGVRLAEADGWLDPATYLEGKGDWKDWRKWPRADGEAPAHEPTAKMEDPTAKPGIIGAFCRIFTIPDAMTAFNLPYVEIVRDRYAYAGGSGAPGAVHYGADNLLHSWHESDPARGTKNAWDLVRIHRHGHLDEGLDHATPINERPSQAAMTTEAIETPEVHAELAAEEFGDDIEEIGVGADPGAIEPGGIGNGHEPAQGDGGGVSAFEALVARINGAGPINRESRREIVRGLAATALSSADVSTLAGHIRAGHEDPAPDKQSIIDEIKQTRKRLTGKRETGGDADLLMVEECLNEHYKGGDCLRRFARQFWKYDGGVWHAIDDEIVRGTFQRTIIGLRGRANIDARIADALDERNSAGIAGSLWTFFCAHVSERTAKEYGAKDPMGLLRWDMPSAMNCKNTEIHFEPDGSIRRVKHAPKHLFTSQLDVGYDENANTDQWDEFCELMFSNHGDDYEDMKRHLEEFCGYVLQPWRELPTFGVMKGAPDAGKSTLGRVLNLILGESVANRGVLKYDGSDSHDTAGLVGKTLLLDDDYDTGGLLPDAFIKQSSEAKHMTVNPKGKGQFSFVCRVVPLVLTNSWPRIRDHSGALEKRALVWDLASIPKMFQDDKARYALFREGIPGAFKRFVDGFARLHERGAWKLPAACVEARNTWMHVTDSVALWASERLVENPESFLPRSGLHERYKSWFQQATPSGRVLGRTEFITRLSKRLGEPVKRTGAWGWMGLEFQAMERAGDFDQEED